MAVKDGELKFYAGLSAELICWPFLYARNIFKSKVLKYFPVKNIPSKLRKDIEDPVIHVNIHEWGGYAGKRTKKIRGIKEFTCGLDYQLQRFKSYSGQHKVSLSITLSDPSLLKDPIEGVPVYPVSNKGMDFSGYRYIFEKLKDGKNSYIILTNSSVNALQTDFLDGYIEFMEQHPTIGLLGVSYCTKAYQTFIRNNFNPHVQSFFLLTTTEVLKEVVQANNKFPGDGIEHKLSLIIHGEIKLSRIVTDLGYDIACILENGQPYVFNRSCLRDNGAGSWKKPFGDYRKVTSTPNAINSIKN